MARRFLLSLLAFALFTTEAASAQTTPATTTAPQPYKSPAQLARAQRRAGRTLTARERRQAEAIAKATAKAQAEAALASANPTTDAKEWSGWSYDPMPTPASDPLTGRPTTNLSVAPGMPLNQVGHGVTTDYDGHPIRRTPASTTMAAQR